MLIGSITCGTGTGTGTGSAHVHKDSSAWKKVTFINDPKRTCETVSVSQQTAEDLIPSNVIRASSDSSQHRR